METSIINKDHNQHNHDFPLNSNSNSNSHSHSPSFLIHKRFNSPEIEISDIEMITLASVTYTSLKDILSATTQSQPITASIHNSSWDEIPIKNPLVKQAALAYLQPMSTPPEVEDRRLIGKLKKCGFGCFVWINDVVLRTFKDVFGGEDRRGGNEFYEDEDEDEDEYEDEDEVDGGEGRAKERAFSVVLGLTGR